MKLRITLCSGGVIDWETPADFNFVVCAQAVKACGFFNNRTLFIPYENIDHMFVYDPQKQMPVDIKTKGMMQ